MNRLLLILASLIVAAILYVGFAPSDPPREGIGSGSTAPSNRMFESSHGSGRATPEKLPRDVSAVAEGLTEFKQILKKLGAVESLPISKDLESAVKSNNDDEIQRAFHEAVYDRSNTMSEVTPVLTSYLSHPNPLVRFPAAQGLCVAGENSGVPTLLQLAQEDHPTPWLGQDLHVRAARVLSQFRVSDAIPIIQKLYSATRDSELLRPLAILGARATESVEWPFVLSDRAITNYGLAKADNFLPQLRSVYQTAPQEEEKLAAAWAVSRLAGDEDAIRYLATAAEPAIEAHPKTGEELYNPSSLALRYLGSVDHPIAIASLLRALESDNPVAVQYATVNLLFNQPAPAPEAVEVVLGELQGRSRKFGSDLLLQIASKLDDPRVQLAGLDFDARSGERSSHMWSVERSRWPIYNWIDGYVAVLNRLPTSHSPSRHAEDHTAKEEGRKGEKEKGVSQEWRLVSGRRGENRVSQQLQLLTK